MSNEIINIPQTEIVLYQPDESTRLEVRLEDETVWLTQDQIALLFQKERSGITKHINKIFKDGELEEKSNVNFFHVANSDKPVKFYPQCRRQQDVRHHPNGHPSRCDTLRNTINHTLLKLQ